MDAARLRDIGSPNVHDIRSAAKPDVRQRAEAANEKKNAAMEISSLTVKFANSRAAFFSEIAMITQPAT